MTKNILIIAISLLLIEFNSAASQQIIPANQNTLDSIKQANKGNVILFNFWATWCKPCVEEFPDLIKLNKRYKDKNFKIVFITLDLADALKNETPKFLKSNKVDFVTYYNAFDNDDDLINYMDKNWDGGIPGTFILDKDGNLQKTFIGKREYNDFREVVDTYLKK